MIHKKQPVVSCNGWSRPTIIWIPNLGKGRFRVVVDDGWSTEVPFHPHITHALNAQQAGKTLSLFVSQGFPPLDKVIFPTTSCLAGSNWLVLVNLNESQRIRIKSYNAHCARVYITPSCPIHRSAAADQIWCCLRKGCYCAPPLLYPLLSTLWAFDDFSEVFF